MNESTATKIYEALLEIKEEQGVQRGTLDQILLQAKKTNGQLKEHDRRIDELEKARDEEKGAAGVKTKAEQRRWRVKLITISAGISAVIGAIVTKVFDLFSGKGG